MVCNNNYTFYEYQVDNHSNIYFLQIEYSRMLPSLAYGKCEFFVSREYLEEKVESLRNRNSVVVYEWILSENRWNEIERRFNYEDEKDIIVIFED